jgi:hypothetical protein
MDRRWPLDWIGCGVVWAFTFLNSDGIRRFDQAYLRRAADMGEGRRGNVN